MELTTAQALAGLACRAAWTTRTVVALESRVLACLTNAAALAGNSAAAILPRTTPYGLTP